MNELVTQQFSPPDTLEDLAKFVLVGREKLVSVKAEIKAIERVGLAKEVRNQKKEEAQMLSEALLDAEVKLGDLLKQIPKDNSFRGNQWQSNTVVTLPKTSDSTVPFEKHITFKNAKNDITSIQRGTEVIKTTKENAISELGFDKIQAYRFETLADNKDLVEQVKEEARANDDIPTRSRVLNLVQERKRREKEAQQASEVIDDYNTYIEECHKTSLKYHEALYKIKLLEVNDNTLKQFKEMLIDMPESVSSDYLNIVKEAIPKLLKIQNFLKEVRR